MRQVIGRTIRDVDAAGFAELRAPYRCVVLDVGTGDGKHVLTVARQRPDVLVVGLDAAPDALRPASARAAAKPARGGTPNAIFVWAAAEALPVELTDLDAVHVLMPWGSLLRAVVTPEPQLLETLAARARPGARFLVTLNLHAWRPSVPEVGDTVEPTPESVIETWAPAAAGAGWHLDVVDRPDAATLAELGTSWTKRLGSSRTDLAVLRLTGILGGAG